MVPQVLKQVVNLSCCIYIRSQKAEIICIFDIAINNVHDYYIFIIKSFENHEKYEIIFSNTNNKFIKIIIKENICYKTTTLKNILWIKNKKDYNNEDTEYSIILNKNKTLILDIFKNYENINNLNNDNLNNDNSDNDNTNNYNNTDNIIINFFKNMCKNISEFFY